MAWLHERKRYSSTAVTIRARKVYMSGQCPTIASAIEGARSGLMLVAWGRSDAICGTDAEKFVSISPPLTIRVRWPHRVSQEIQTMYSDAHYSSRICGLRVIARPSIHPIPAAKDSHTFRNASPAAGNGFSQSFFILLK